MKNKRIKFVSTPPTATDFIAELCGIIFKAAIALGVAYVFALLVWAIFGGY
jgi:hypothetical protein